MSIRNNIIFKVLRILTVFSVILVVAFSPFVELAYYFLPNPLAEQIAQFAPQTPRAYAAINTDVYIFITYASASGGAGNWTVPADWNPASNSIEVIGGGGSGGDGTTSAGAGGGGGGGYAKITNLSFEASSTSIPFSVGASGSAAGSTAKGGDGGHTWFGKSTYALCDSAGPNVCVSAEGGEGGGGSASGPAFAAGKGGFSTGTSSGSWDVAYAGGNGGIGNTNDSNGGGGGAGGPHISDGAGKAGNQGGTTTADGGGGGGGGGGGSSTAGSAGGTSAGGNGGAGYLGGAGGSGNTGGAGAAGVNVGSGGGGGDAGANSGGDGGAGAQWLSAWGSGGGGGGAGDGGTAGGKGGLYGAGGGGGATNTTSPNGRGGNGIIVIKYRPLANQSKFQWYNDDAALGSATAISAINGKASGSEALAINTTYRVRLQVANIKTGINGSKDFTNHKFRLEMTRAGTSCVNGSIASGWQWRTVPLTANTASDAFDIEATSNFADGASISSNALGAPTGATTFTNGYALDARATTGYQTIADNAYTEIEWAVKPNSNANTSADYCFRAGWITDDSTTPDTRSSMSYSKIASASVQAPVITVSGTCKQSDQSTSCSDGGGNHKIRVAVNGSLSSSVDETVDGSWSISNVSQPTAGQIVTVFIEGETSSASQAVAVTEYSSGNVGSIELLEGHLTVGSDQNTTISNAELGDYDSSVSDQRTFHDNSGTTLTVDVDSGLASDELYIASGDNFTPGGQVNADDVEIFGTFDLGSNTASISGTWDDNGTFTAGTSKIEMTGTSETLDASTFYQLEINPSSTGTITSSGSFSVTNGLEIASGDTLSIPSGQTITYSGTALTVTGTVEGSGTLTLSSTAGTISGGGSTANLTIDPSSAGTITLNSALTVTGTLTISSSDTLKVTSGNTLTLSGTGTPLSVSGTFEPHSGSTVAYTGSSSTVTATTFGGLTLGGSGTYTLPATSPTIKGDLTVSSGATVASGSGTLLFRKGGSQTLTDSTTNKQNLGEIVVRASTSGNTTLTLGSSVRVASVSIEASQTLDSNGSKTLTIQGSDSGSASPFNISGTFTVSTGTVKYTGNSVTVIVPASGYASLSLGGAGTYTLPASNLTVRGNLAVANGATVTKSSTNVLVFDKGGGGFQTLTDSNTTKQDLGEIKISANGGNTTLTLGSSVKISSVSIDSSQTLDAGGTNTIEVTGTSDVFNNNGTFAPRTGTVQYTATTANIGASKYGGLTLGGTGTYTGPSSGTTTILGDLTITSGATYASGSSTWFFRKGGTQSITDSNSTKQNLGEIAIQASASATTLTLGGSIKIASATVDASQTLSLNGTNTLTITGTSTPFTASGSFGTFTPSTGAVVFTGNAATNIPTLDYYDLKVQPSANSITHTFLSGTASVSKTFTIGNGTNTGVVVDANTNGAGLDVASVSISVNSTLTADNSSEFTVARNFINNGTFTHSSGTVTFGAGSDTASISGTGPITFNNLTATTQNKKIKFQAGKIVTFEGTLTLTGGVSNLMRIESTASGSQWYAYIPNPVVGGVTYTRFQDSGCSGGTAKITLDGTNSNQGNNGTCWFEIQLPPIGGGGGYSEGGQSGGGNQQGGGGQGGGGGDSEGGSGGGGQEGGGGQGGGGGGSPVIFDWPWLLGNTFHIFKRPLDSAVEKSGSLLSAWFTF